MTNKIFKFKYNKFNPSVNEWSNSIYSFNKYKLNTSLVSRITFDIFNSYFNIKLFKPFISEKVYREKFSTLKRIFVGIPEIKNSLNKIDISVYVFNKEKFIIDEKIKNLNKTIKTNKLKTLKKVNFSNNNNWLTIFNGLINKLFFNNYEIITNLLKKRIENSFNIEKSFMKKKLNDMRILLDEKYCTLFLYKYYISEKYLNRLKFNSINLFHLKKILYKIYNKEVNVNIINLKYLYLDNSIYIDAIVRKLRERKRKVLRVMRKALILPKIPRIDPMFLLKKEKEINNVIYNIIGFNKIDILKTIFESLKNIHVTGIRLEGKGRLTRRLTASRAVHKKAYKGSLKNIYSSYKGLSVLTTKGFNRSNLNYINLNSNGRNGSYGIKSWQSTM